MNSPRHDRKDETLTSLPCPADSRCFGCGAANSSGMKLEFFLAADRSVVSTPVVPSIYESLKGCVHGGIVATLLDEIMSKAVHAAGAVIMTRHMEIDYLLPVPSGAPLRVEGRVTRHEGRKHFSEGRILDQDGNLLARGKALFLEVARESSEAPYGAATPGGKA